MADPTNLKAAKAYLDLGFSPIPVKGKSQHLIKWKPYQDRKPTVDELQEWWGKWPDANVGIVTGPVSNLLVVDVDSQEAWERLQEFLPETFQGTIARTPRGGYHLWFTHEDGFSNKAGYLPNVDVRTTGGFIMVPPSQNGKGRYTWHDGCKYNSSTGLYAIPSLLKEKLLSICSIVSRVGDTKRHEATRSDIFDWSEGKRDDSLFHLAYLILKGGGTVAEADNVLKLVMDSWSEGHMEKWRMDKILSAKERVAGRDRNIADEVREWVEATPGDFLATDCDRFLDLATRSDKKAAQKALERLCKEGVIERKEGRRGHYRTVDKSINEVDWVNASMEYRKLWLPLDLDTMFGALPGNIGILAGAKDSGKTAWLMNIAKENSHWYKTRYINSEMGEAEFRLRMSKFPEPLEDMAKRISMCCHSSNFADKLLTGEGCLNIIDFLEVTTDFWKVAEVIKQIHERLDGALAIIAIQKKRGADLGRGAEFSMEKSRLYVSLDYGKAKIVSCKNFRPESPIGNPRGYVCEYKLVDGCRILKQPPGWHTEIEK